MMTDRFPVRRTLRTALLASLISAQLLTTNAYAQVTLNFVNADIDQVAKAIGAATGRTIIVDPRVKGQLNLVSEESVPEEQALKILQAALRMQGFSLVQDHGVLKVVPEADAKVQGVPTYVGNAPQARGDQIITQVFQLRNESANNLLPVLRPLISPNNTIAAYPANNTLVVTDYADNIRRIASIIAGIDTSAGQSVVVVPLKNANAIDIAPIMQKLLDPGAIGSSDATLKVNVTADPRTNSLMLRATNAARQAQAKKLAAELDAPTLAPGNIHVIPLRNASAAALAKTLRGMLGQSSGNDSSSKSDFNSFGQNEGGMNGGSSGGGNSSSNSLGGIAPLPSGTGSGLGGSSGGQSGGGLGGASGANSGGSGSDNNQQGGGMIVADTATNSLIVTAPDPVYRNLRNVIEQLDARRAQVYLESIIVELTSTSAAQLGIQWQALIGGGSTRVFSGTNFSSPTSNGIVNLTAAGAAAAQPGGLATLATTASALNNGLNVGILHQFGNLFGLGGLLQALSTISDANVLSTPNLTTLDNEEAKIVVGQNVPVISGSFSTVGSTSSVTPFQTFDREDVGTMLHVKPQISQDGLIKLQIYEESSAVVAGTANSINGPTINKRSIETTVLANDGQIIVLGGLISDQYANDNSKVPWLGNLPVIGSLFRQEDKNRMKDDLMVFIRPVIVRDSDDSRNVTLSRYDYMRADMGNYQSDNQVMLDRNIPQLPPAPPESAHSMFDLNRMQRQPGQPVLSPNPQTQPPYAPDPVPAPPDTRQNAQPGMPMTPPTAPQNPPVQAPPVSAAPPSYAPQQQQYSVAQPPGAPLVTRPLQPSGSGQ